jgi:tRNA (guanine26-N2/guanine27-N2)-dimethyltransferase
MDYAGPLWIGGISDPVFIEQTIKENGFTAFKNSAKITKLLNVIRNETTAPATYYVIDKLSSKLNLPAPSNESLLSALRRNGFQAIPTHFNPRGIKTDSPALTMHKLLREIVETK